MLEQQRRHFYTNSFTKTNVFVFLSIFKHKRMHLYDVYIAVLHLHSECFKSDILRAHIYLYVYISIRAFCFYNGAYELSILYNAQHVAMLTL